MSEKDQEGTVKKVEPPPPPPKVTLDKLTESVDSEKDILTQENNKGGND